MMRPVLLLPSALLLLLLTPPARTTCPEADQIHCGTSDRCTRIRYICDGDNDCGDNTDEASSLCAVWRNSACERNSARCHRMNRSDCVTISHYCTLDNPPCEGDLDMRLCVMLREGKIRPLHTISHTTTTPAPTVPPTTLPPIHMREESETWSEQFKASLASTISHPDCQQLFTKVGDQCISIFFLGNLTWLESRTFCQSIGGDLYTISSDLVAFTTLLQHLRAHQLTADFWVGGRYVNDSSGWNWVDNTPLQMGSPFWAVRHHDQCSTRPITYPLVNLTSPANSGSCYRYSQAPAPLPTGHCAALTYQHYYYLSDEDCFGRKSPLCVQPGTHPKQAV